MRINKYIALHTNLSRRKADTKIQEGRVHIDKKTAQPGDKVHHNNTITLDNKVITPVQQKEEILLIDKPTGYVCSHKGQGSPTVYNLIPKDKQHLQIAGRLDKDSSGLLLFTNNGALIHALTHPSGRKKKVYRVTINSPLTKSELHTLEHQGVDIGDERFSLFASIQEIDTATYQVCIHEGRNRQIRRTFHALNRKVLSLRRIQIGPYSLKDITYVHDT